jgi:anthranilate phosphoribosyltransferase
MVDEARLRAFGGVIVRLQQRHDLTRDEARAAFNQIWRNEQPDLQQGAFIAALHSKGETRDEILGAADSHNDDWSRHVPGQVSAPEPHLGIVGVGMDTLKTVNVSSGAAIIAAACGIYIHKIGAPGMTGVSGSAETFALLGVDADVDHAVACQATAQCRLGFTSVVGRAAQASGIFRVLSQLRCGTSVHIAGPMGFHSGERHKIIGVPRPDLVPLVCGAMQALGYRRALVPCGGALEFPGRYMDEFSTVGPTIVAELHEDGRISEYELGPEEAGLVCGRYQDVAAAPSAHENVRAVARVLAGLDRGPLLDLLALNAAACLKLMGKVDRWDDGVARARAAVVEGGALEQLRALITAQNADPVSGLARLDAFIDGTPLGVPFGASVQ